MNGVIKVPSSAMDNNTTKLFRAVIVARSCPTVLETQLRKHSQNIRNVETLPGNAIAVFPSSHSITVAIRVYHLDEPSIAAISKTQAKSTRIPMSDPAASLDFDHLQSFRDSFKFPVVFFISHRLQETFAQQLEDPHSVLHRAQDALVCAQCEDETEATQGSAKVFLVPEYTAIIPMVHAILESLKPDKLALKESYFAQESQKAFYPPTDSKQPYVHTLSASAHVASALRSCILALGISQGDANVVMSMLETIQGIVAADDHTWNTIPIGNREKKILRNFFSGTKSPMTMDVNPLVMGQSWESYDLHSFQGPAVVSYPHTNTKNIAMDRHGKRNFKEFMSHRNVEELKGFHNHTRQDPRPSLDLQQQHHHDPPSMFQFHPATVQQSSHPLPSRSRLISSNVNNYGLHTTNSTRPRVYRGLEYNGNLY